MELLAPVCAARGLARVAPVHGGEACESVTTRFLALESDHLVVAWPGAGTGLIAPSDESVDVFFRRCGVLLALRTQTLGPLPPPPGQMRISGWKLALPLRIERRQQRVYPRLSLESFPPVLARMTSTTENRRSFTAQLLNLSRTGLGATVPHPDGMDLSTDASYWVVFELPGESSPFEFVARVRHAQISRSDGAARLGCVLCPGEETGRQADALLRLERSLRGLRPKLLVGDDKGGS